MHCPLIDREREIPQGRKNEQGEDEDDQRGLTKPDSGTQPLFERYPIGFSGYSRQALIITTEQFISTSST